MRNCSQLVEYGWPLIKWIGGMLALIILMFDKNFIVVHTHSIYVEFVYIVHVINLFQLITVCHCTKYSASFSSRFSHNILYVSYITYILSPHSSPFSFPHAIPLTHVSYITPILSPHSSPFLLLTLFPLHIRVDRFSFFYEF